MNKRISAFALILLCLHHQRIFAIRLPSGSTAISNGKCRLIDSGVFSVSNHTASMTMNKTPILGLSASNLYSLRVINHFNISGVMPYRHSAFGFHYTQSGNDLYRYAHTGIGMAQELSSKLSLGAKFNYKYLGIPTYGHKNDYDFDLSLKANIHPKLSSGISIENILGNYSSSMPDHTEAGIVVLGIIYQADKKIKLCFEAEKNEAFPLDTRIGLQYELDSMIKFGSGFSDRFREIHFGFLIRRKDISIGAACMVNMYLGISSNISLIYEIKD